MMTPGPHTKQAKVRVVLFSGGRGSSVLSKQLIANPRVDLTLAVNGYDDGASTGEVRRFLGDSLGPSDFRKNASRLAGELQSCPRELIELVDYRLPDGYSAADAEVAFRIIAGTHVAVATEPQAKILKLVSGIDPATRGALAVRLEQVEKELARTGFNFTFGDCAIGNLIFAGCFLECRRDFNAAIADYCALMNVPNGLIENVTDGTNAFLVAMDRDGRILASEADIVDANRRNRIKDIYLVDKPPDAIDMEKLARAGLKEKELFLERRSVSPAVNPTVLERIAEADLIIYSPGTQHSSLFPSYLNAGIGSAIAQNLTAIKLLITNLQEDADIAGVSAVEIIEKAAYYLKQRDSLPIPTPCLITHYLINDHERTSEDKPYVPLGRIETLEDPRLVRIGAYEEGGAGRHDAAKILTPFIESILHKDDRRRLAVWLIGTRSLNKICQSILEMMRGGIGELPLSVTVFYHHSDSFAPAFTGSLPFPVVNVSAPKLSETEAFLQATAKETFDYVILFESSGMYRGEDIVNLASLLTHRRLDAVWGSRRLSVKDIHESYRLRYKHNLILGAASYAGSHLLSVAYLLRYGRYVSDTLSGVRAIRASVLLEGGFDLTHPCLNQALLSRLLSDRAEVFETPVQFFSLSPEKVKRTTIREGLQSLFAILRGSSTKRRPEPKESNTERPELTANARTRGTAEHR